MCIYSPRKIVRLFKSPMINALAKSKRFIRAHTFERLEEMVKPFVSSVHQAGEGWVIMGQILRHLENGVNNIVITVP